MNPLIKISKNYDQRLFNKFNLINPLKDYNLNVGLYNAQDYYFQNAYPVPERYSIKKILDFGAGYGRQANIWLQLHKNIMYVGMDALPKSYCLQHLYYSQLNCNFYEYILNPHSFKINNKSNGIYHIPTWRYDLLPQSSFDLVICSQVLQEINRKLVKFMIEVFKKVLKPGGILYIRDTDSKWRPAHHLDLNSFLPKKGFVLEFKPHVIDGKDIHGIPRIWRKVDKEVIKKRKKSFVSKLVEHHILIGVPLLKLYTILKIIFKHLKNEEK